VTGAPDPEPLAGPAYLRLVLIGALIGVPAALLAAGFLALVHQLEHVLWHDLPDELGYSSVPWFLVIGLPVIGAGLVALARHALPGDGGHEPLGGISVVPTALAAAPGVALAALGSVVGVAASRLVKLPPRENQVVATAGSFSAISALFGGPLPAGMLLVEAGLGTGAALLPLLVPGLVAAAFGYLIFVGLGDWGGIETAALAVPGLPRYEGTTLWDMLLGLVVGVATALVVVVTHQTARRLAGLREQRVSMPVLLLAGGLAVGCLAELADVLGADSQSVLFSGQAALPELVVEGSAGVVIVLVAAKAIAYGICLGCGFRGGPVFPAIFLGIGFAMLAVIAFDVSPTLAVAVGTAAGTAAATRLLISALLIAALLVGTAGLDAIPAAVLAACGAWLTVTALDKGPAAA
jgi:H+/Cl- antiporter ClcA